MMSLIILLCHTWHMFYVINCSISVLCAFGNTFSHFVYSYSFASINSGISSVFVFSDESPIMSRKRLELKQKMFDILRLLYISTI